MSNIIENEKSPNTSAESLVAKLDKTSGKSVSTRLASVLISPRVTSKSYQNASGVIFNVLPSANKLEIKAAVELFLGVEVVSVATLRNKGKQRRVKGRPVRTGLSKKAYVTLKNAQEVDLLVNRESQ